MDLDEEKHKEYVRDIVSKMASAHLLETKKQFLRDWISQGRNRMYVEKLAFDAFMKNDYLDELIADDKDEFEQLVGALMHRGATSKPGTWEESAFNMSPWRADLCNALKEYHDEARCSFCVAENKRNVIGRL